MSELLGFLETGGRWGDETIGDDVDAAVSVAVAAGAAAGDATDAVVEDLLAAVAVA